MNGSRLWNMHLLKHRVQLLLWGIMEYFEMILLIQLKDLFINVCVFLSWLLWVIVRSCLVTMIFCVGRDKRPVKSLVVGRPILLALEDIDGGPSFLEKALRFLEKHGKLLSKCVNIM